MCTRPASRRRSLRRPLRSFVTRRRRSSPATRSLTFCAKPKRGFSSSGSWPPSACARPQSASLWRSSRPSFSPSTYGPFSTRRALGWYSSWRASAWPSSG
eukprot:Amastigsp_a340643_24.p6 type:complete len:100 gc:universal Amastigsp_a340643_24:656-955(+)